jgi:hypothetical protein
VKYIVKKIAGIESMMLRNRGFSGGYRFRAFQGAPRNVLTHAKIPQKTIIP